MKKINFISFFFDSNSISSDVTSYEDWERVCKTWSVNNSGDIYKARISSFVGGNDIFPNFGFYPEHKGEQTLGDFFDKNEMTRSLIKD